jgi:hypothetical protein
MSITTIFQSEVKQFMRGRRKNRRSQWPHGLRNELPPPARTLGSWVRDPLEAWMSVCVYSVFVLFCVQVGTLRRADHQFSSNVGIFYLSHNTYTMNNGKAVENLLACDTKLSGKCSRMFPRNKLPPSSGSKRKPSKYQQEPCSKQSSG